jgi:hypothetical protein
MGSNERDEKERQAWERVPGEGSPDPPAANDQDDGEMLPADGHDTDVENAQQADPRLTEAE